MRDVRATTTLELTAPIATVFEVLTRLSGRLDDAGGWVAAPATWDLFDGPITHRWRLPHGRELTVTSTTTAAQAPDVLTWQLGGDVTGRIEFELDDLDEVTFVRSTWWVRPSAPARLALGVRGARLVDVHEQAMGCLAAAFARRFGPVRVRPAGDRGAPMRLAVADQPRR